MRELITELAPWILSALTIWVAFLAGDKNKHTWSIGLAAQALWLTWIIASGTWGMLPGNIALWIVYARNHFKWSADVAENQRRMEENQD